jgi:hypothetical protein
MRIQARFAAVVSYLHFWSRSQNSYYKCPICVDFRILLDALDGLGEIEVKYRLQTVKFRMS